MLLALFSASASQSIVAPALPRIADELGGMAHYSWVATATLLASAVAIPVAGKLSDAHGPRRVYVFGLVVFGTGSALAGMAPTYWWLVAARGLQGIGLGCTLALSQVIVGELVSPRERGRYQGYLGASFGLATVVGPLAGGWLTDHASWRWCFYVNLPIVALAVVCTLVFLRLPGDGRHGRLDIAGMGRLAVGLVALLAAISLGGGSAPWGSAPIIGLFALGAGMLAAFAAAERRAEDPILPPALLRNGTFRAAVLGSFLVATALFGATFFIPLFAQRVLGQSATNSGVVLLPLAIALVVSSTAVGRLITRTGIYKPFMLAGGACIVAGYAILTRLGEGSSTWELGVALAVLGAGLGATSQNFVLVVQNVAPAGQIGTATATAQLCRSVGAALGVGGLGSIMTARLAEEPTGSAGTAAALHPLFVIGLAVALAATAAIALIRRIPLRESVAA